MHTLPTTTNITVFDIVALKSKAVELLHWINSPVVSDERKEFLSDQYFDVMTQLKMAA